MSTVTVVATPEPNNVPPRVRLDVTDSGSPAITATTVNRLDPNGATVPVRTTDGNPLPLITSGSVRTGLLYDYEMQYGATVSYSTVETPSSRSAEVVVPSASPWIVHPGVPALSQTITAVKVSARRRPVSRGVHRPMGRRNAVVQTDGQRKSAEYTLTVRTLTDQQRIALDALFDDAGVLLLNVPTSKQWGIGAEYVSIGDTDEDREARWGREPRRIWDLPIIVVDRPAGGSQAQRTLIDLLAYPTLDSLGAQYPTLNDVLAGP